MGGERAGPGPRLEELREGEIGAGDSAAAGAVRQVPGVTGHAGVQGSARLPLIGPEVPSNHHWSNDAGSSLCERIMGCEQRAPW